jgi:two-component system response regulator
VILFVEDDPDDEDLILDALVSGGLKMEIKVARDGAEALEMVSGAQLLPRLVVMDLKLPKVSGLDVLRRIRGDARTRHIPIVVLSSSSQESDIRSSYESGANSYVRKPVESGAFAQAVQTLATYWSVFNEPMRDPG